VLPEDPNPNWMGYSVGHWEGDTQVVDAPIELDLRPDQELIEYVCENERDAPHLVGKSGEEFRVPVEILSQYAGTYETPDPRGAWWSPWKGCGPQKLDSSLMQPPSPTSTCGAIRRALPCFGAHVLREDDDAGRSSVEMAGSGPERRDRDWCEP
jgi:hypothetical protein